MEDGSLETGLPGRRAVHGGEAWEYSLLLPLFLLTHPDPDLSRPASEVTPTCSGIIAAQRSIKLVCDTETSCLVSSVSPFCSAEIALSAMCQCGGFAL